MSLIPDKCIEYTGNQSICVAKANGKQYVLKNVSGHTIQKINIDCLGIKSQKCDFLLKLNKDNIGTSIFVELKGGAMRKAIGQIISTIEYLKKEVDTHRLQARIVGSRNVPGLIQLPEYIKLDRIVSASGGNIKRATNKYLEEKF